MPSLSQQQIDQIIANAKAVALKAKENASKSDISTAVKDSLIDSSEQIQGILDVFLSNAGILTQDQYDRLDEQIRIAKKNNLEAETLDSTKRLALYTALVVGLFAALWFITYEKQTK